MKSYDATTYNALLAAPDAGIAPRRLAYFWVRSLDGLSTEEFGFWTDYADLSIPVYRGDTGAQVTRNYIGEGSLLEVGSIRQTADLKVNTLTLKLSQVHASVQNMVRGYDIRQARVEIHTLLLHPNQGGILTTATCDFVGKVDKAPILTPVVGGEGAVTLQCVSHTRELTRRNPARKSDETQKLRSGDRFRRYITTANANVWWGMERDRAAGDSQTLTTSDSTASSSEKKSTTGGGQRGSSW